MAFWFNPDRIKDKWHQSWINTNENEIQFMYQFCRLVWKTLLLSLHIMVWNFGFFDSFFIFLKKKTLSYFWTITSLKWVNKINLFASYQLFVYNNEIFSISIHSNVILHPWSVVKMLSFLLKKSYVTARTKVTADC